tara:strand:+ start:2097 stop:3635 length:1539 start_codon:yes stop_codon:yes gene_type:complete
MKSGEDGAIDRHGDLLPVLSESATKMKFEKLMNTPLPKFGTNYPGSPFFMELGYFCLRRVNSVIFRTHEISGTEKIPLDRGSMCTAWHTNGLLDPISIFLSHPKKFVVGGRHDLVTRPILGFWARKFAVQPVVRKAELLRGGCSEEDANYMNGRSLLNLATGISYGYGCALFPEGTSHSESHLIRLKTGPVRTALAAAGHAKANGHKLPVIIPIGLHYRTRHLFRTDAWVEYGNPIELPVDELPDDLVEKLGSGDWSEPPAETVNKIRDTLREKLAPLTPNRETFSEVHRDGVIAHVRNNSQGKPTLSWKQEVLAVRELLSSPASDEVQSIAKKIGDTLEDSRLDGRDINKTNDGLRGFSPMGAVTNLMKLIPMLSLLPIILVSMGPQVALGRALGDNTDEGLDARTSYQFLTGMFGSMLFWPIIAAIMIALYIGMGLDIGIDVLAIFGGSIFHKIGAIITTFAALHIIFWISGVFFALGWDAFSDTARWMRRRKTAPMVSDDLKKLNDMIN